MQIPNVLFFGAGDLAQRIFRSLKNEKINVRAFIEENVDPSKIICGTPVIDLQSIKQMDFDYIFVAIRDTDLAFEKLLKLQIEESKLISTNFIAEAYKRAYGVNNVETSLPSLIKNYIESIPVLKSVIDIDSILADEWIRNEHWETSSLKTIPEFVSCPDKSFFPKDQFRRTPDSLIADLTLIRIESTAFCTYSCYFCAAKDMKRKRGTMSQESLQRITEQIGDFSGTVHLHHSGEPLLDKELIKKVAYIRKAWPHSQIGINTTLGVPVGESFLDELWTNGLNFMHISFYGYSNEVYQKIHGVPLFDLAKKNIEHSLKSKARLDAGGQLAFRLLHMEEVEGFGAEYVSAMNEFARKVNASPNVILHNTFVTSYAGQTVLRKSVSLQPCSVVWGEYRRILNLTWDLNIVPCCIDSDEGAVLGNLKESSLQEIFASERYQDFVKSHWSDCLNNYPICMNCEKHIGGTTNELLLLAFAKISEFLSKDPSPHICPIAFVGEPLFVNSLSSLFSDYNVISYSDVLKYCSTDGDHDISPYVFFAAIRQSALIRLNQLSDLEKHCTKIKPIILPLFGAGYNDSRELAEALVPYAELWNN